VAALRSKREPAKVVRLVPAPRTASPSLDDAAILAAVRAGDVAAATALHSRIRPVVDKTIQRLLGRADSDHDDLVQVSLIEVVRSLVRFRGECSLDTWVSRVSAHTVFKELRRRRVEHGVFDRSAPPDSRGGDLEEHTLERSTVKRVREHLDAMSPDRAFAVVLHDVCGHDLREVAEIMDVSVAAAQSRLVRGRRELHERIAKDPELSERMRRTRRDSDG
jgi:RNA polymerase sigma-70 factor (ECF subfamily)